MRNVAVCARRVGALLPEKSSMEIVEVDRVPVGFGVVRTREPDFDRTAPGNATRVLVKVTAFSCNYRDKAFILSAAAKATDNSFYVLGSEFAGTVVAVGPEVSGLQLGDRVIGDNAYSGHGICGEGAPEGLATNHASREYQVLDQRRMHRVPAEMPATVAAGFGVGSQTAYAMIRKVRTTPGARVLVTSARSNTSLFVINALRAHDVEVYATTTSAQCGGKLRQLGVKEVFEADLHPREFTKHEQLVRVARRIGRFDCVIDPFFDLNLAKALGVLAPGGTYITCGLARQDGAPSDPAPMPTAPRLEEVLLRAIVYNHQIIGNCLGTTEDLESACRDYAAGRLEVVIDSVFSGDKVGAFIERTFCARGRFGKVIFQYE